mmetsp:Transcript_10975/g.24571  ORF Transcript_10975/g.24571 Transcript_10975/m.24571 type:complete len:109 (-) Transcript_10975:2735-3061(-)
MLAAASPAPAEKPALGENAPSGDRVSCVNFTLSDGATTIDVDASSACYEACHDRRDHLLRSNETTTDRHEPYMYDHDKRMGYYYYHCMITITGGEIMTTMVLPRHVRR